MAVITRYIVVRNGVELDKVFSVKKEADAYDKMLDAADNLSAFIKESDTDFAIDDAVIDEISVFLAKNGPEVSRILKGIKPVSSPVKSAEGKPAEKTDPSDSKGKQSAKPGKTKKA